MFEIEMLPAREGDCLWIRYGKPNSPRQILIDGGRAATAKDLKGRFAALAPKERVFELLIITHVDRDHIEGVLSLLTDTSLKLTFKDIWFNGFDHLNQAKLETFGAVQGERLSAALVDRKLPWNKAWKRKAVCVNGKALPTKKLEGGLQLTLLSPDAAKLRALIPVWEKECKRAGLIAGIGSKPAEARGLESFGAINIERLAASRFAEDAAQANGSSIAVLAHYDGKKVLLAGDAHTDRLGDSIRLLKKSAKRLKIDAFKLAHHGSEHNVSRELLALLDCPRYLVSTNGSYFKHPSAGSLARVVKFTDKDVVLYFNYRTKFTSVWDNHSWQATYGYTTRYPDKKHNGTLVVSL
jgi:beta-lactamase superfamily II metal-dependent hydrolase